MATDQPNPVEHSLLTPLWQRIARGEVDLSKYTDDEILSGHLRMVDGRTLPQPATYPETFVREQAKRGMRKAQNMVRKGAITALEVYQEILEDDQAEDKDRIKAGAFFLERFLGKTDQHVVVHAPDAAAARQALVDRLVAARSGLPAPVAQQLAKGEAVDHDGVYDAELVEEGTLHLDELAELL